MTEDEMVGWHHRHNAHGFVWTPGVGDGQVGLVCCGSWGRKESDTTERLNWTELRRKLLYTQEVQSSALWQSRKVEWVWWGGCWTEISSLSDIFTFFWLHMQSKDRSKACGQSDPRRSLGSVLVHHYSQIIIWGLLKRIKYHFYKLKWPMVSD